MLFFLFFAALAFWVVQLTQFCVPYCFR